LVDLHMPEITGLGLVDAIHAEGSWPLAITDQSDLASARHGKHAGAFAFLDKPVDDTIWVGVIESAWQQRGTRFCLPACQGRFLELRKIP
jgi:FixJ family two-component response regulator